MARVGCPRGCGLKRIIKKGHFITKWNAQPVPRYLCQACGRGFCSHTRLRTWRQRKPNLNVPIHDLYASGMTQRRLAQVLGVDRKTVIRKFLFMAHLAREAHAHALQAWPAAERVQFDEMESFEHTKLKPLAIAIAVEEKSGRLLSAQVASMPCGGKLAGISRRKYGYRADRRPIARIAALKAVQMARPRTLITDAHPAYPGLAKAWLPDCSHLAVKCRMGAKFRPEGSRKNLSDALFTLNYTAAKIRQDLSRMARRTWVTTKKASRLQAHLDLYVAFNNGYRLL
jgi:transposase-like protein